MATIKDIAKKAGVSIGTVDRVIHNRGKVAPAKKELILKIIEELDYQPNDAAQRLTLLRKKIRFAFFVVDPTEHPFFEDVLKGAKQKATELAQYGIEVDFYLVKGPEDSIETSELQTDGIVMLNVDWLRPVICWAHEQEIPVVYYNLPPDDPKGLAYVGCDYQSAGRIAAGLCALVSDKRGVVGILSEPGADASSYHYRVSGFRKEIQLSYPEMQIVESDTSEFGNDMEVGAVRMLRMYPELNLIYLVNPKDYQVCPIIHAVAREAGRGDVKIITNDLTDTQRVMLSQGLISATICQEPEYQGSKPLELLCRYVAFNEIPEKKEYYTKLSIHISQNI